LRFIKHQLLMFVLLSDMGNFIEVNLSGEPSYLHFYIQLFLQATGILIAGFVLWRVNSYVNNQRVKNRRRNNFFETNYSKNWKK